MRCIRVAIFIEKSRRTSLDVVLALHEKEERNGSKFTWQGPKWGHLDRIYKRLDRIVTNSSWRIDFEDATVAHLFKTQSDHNPLLLKLSGNSKQKGKRPFRFIAAWQQHPDFQKIFNDHWLKEFDVPYMLHRIVPDLRKWNRTEENLQQHLNTVLEEEELLWFQKSRHQWIVDGNSNTRFYHLNTIIRRNENKIARLKNDSNQWIEEPEDLKRVACNFFLSLFKEEKADRRWLISQNMWLALLSEDIQMLARLPTQNEIKKVLFDMAPLKAPV
ncbi:uncharacterized protein LOC133309606 [Gastrolobium bilobum]|uniref:uncharacterized protein LOC133309606 n=1 Tax=Gastrolobium bilobum TaxID=150636 RepID=UPI002AB15A1B|nr:uncharacterized protein LOC133309606 [Gastrolobium bilobum]